MRTDAQKNREQLLAAARAVLAEQGVNASLRDIARRAEVGLGTLYRHFPTREALLEIILRDGFETLTVQAEELLRSDSPGEALVCWLRQVVLAAHHPRGVVAAMATAIADESSALHASCVTMRAAGTRLLARAQAAGLARADMEGPDLFAIIGAIAWVYDQPAFESRADAIFGIIADAIVIDIDDGSEKKNLAM